MKSTTAGSSIAGSVSGWTTMEVTPPAAAARAADFSVSLGSAPGSPVLTRMSTRPGASIAPLQSITSDVGRQAAESPPRDHVGDHAVLDQISAPGPS